MEPGSLSQSLHDPLLLSKGPRSPPSPMPAPQPASTRLSCGMLRPDGSEIDALLLERSGIQPSEKGLSKKQIRKLRAIEKQMAAEQRQQCPLSLPSEKGWKKWTGREAGSTWKDAFLAFCKEPEQENRQHCQDKEEEEAEAEEEEEKVEGNSLAAGPSWTELPWDERKAAAARRVLQEEQALSGQEGGHFDEKSSLYWEQFYTTHNNRFFKPRKYLKARYPELVVATEDLKKSHRKKFMEVGCGTGSTLFPLVEVNQRTASQAELSDLAPYFYAFDFSAEAVSLVKANPFYDESKCKAFVCDISCEDLPEEVRESEIDVVTMIFVLSAISPEKMRVVVERLWHCLRPGGFVIFRDYGLLDMTQMRFVAKKGRKLADNFYVRADGTRTFFFELDFVRQLFEATGFRVIDLAFDTRELRNRKRKLSMYRVWACAKLQKPFGALAPALDLDLDPIKETNLSL